MILTSNFIMDSLLTINFKAQIGSYKINLHIKQKM